MRARAIYMGFTAHAVPDSEDLAPMILRPIRGIHFRCSLHRRDAQLGTSTQTGNSSRLIREGLGGRRFGAQSMRIRTFFTQWFAQERTRNLRAK